ncbi:flagellar basal body P-ring formation protein FlgA [Burkholderia sp. FERM BP-3421]|uniref:flagellar basal body P-ring formation chaperone FlgA n=1 Tax=Burkholderia sp. FERM BP-3421 TaxID=1494466 RepID=UPI0023630C47|nr:flagellar basal body P-ring formation chaperone FlgA [Burkholderia sp. FERM BP-3421]WDD95612.1 flagellar basal body P-ring formation protein FlgA [Burkholderia sp. FERM BP-3421]
MTIDAGGAARTRWRHARAALALVLACAGHAAPALAQQAAAGPNDGMIVIPGRGESAEAALANANANAHAPSRPADVSAALEAAALNRRQITQAPQTDPQQDDPVQPGWIRVAPAEPTPRAARPMPGAPMATASAPAAPFQAAPMPATPMPAAPMPAASVAPARSGFAGAQGASGAPAPTPAALRTQPAARPLPLQAAARPARPIAAAAPAASAAVPDGQQDGESIRRAALAFLQQQSAGLPGKTTVTVAPAFPRGLAACTTLEPFMPTGARLWGRTTVGVRCAGERPWTIYLQAKLSVQATYYVAARQIAPGEALSAADLVARDGDLTALPLAIITAPSQAVGATALSRIGAGLPLRQDMLRSAASVSIGQTVRVVAAGQGFTISSEGSVLNNAAPGQQVRVRMAAGQIVTAIVKDAGTVEIPL